MSAQPPLNESNRSISGILKESWSLIEGFKFHINLVFLVSAAAFIIINGIEFFIISYTFIFNIEHIVAMFGKVSIQDIYHTVFVVDILSGIFVWFMMTVLIMLGVRRALGQPIDISPVINECKRAAAGIFIVYLIIVALIVSILYVRHIVSNLGISGEVIYTVSLLFAFYIGLSLLMYTTPLIVTKRCAKITDAINDGFQKMNANWKQVIPVMIAMSMSVCISALFLGVGLVWTIPMFFAATGICYRNAFRDSL